MKSLSLPALLGLVLAAVPAPACAPAPMRGEYVEITNETALIVWDKDTKVEHFIRRANFQSTSPDFGFLVPTPSQPELAEADESVFDALAQYTAPKIEYRTVRKPRPRPREDATRDFPTAAAGPAPKSAPRGVEVLEETEVGGQEAVVLKFRRGPKSDVAEDAKELAEWLKKRGYEFGPQLANWLKPYIANDWVLTAFRIAKRVTVNTGPGPATARPAINEMQGKAVRMSFKTETPFYPYREPEAPAVEPKKPGNWYSPGRFLRVFLMTNERGAATLGKKGPTWAATSPWSDKLNENQMQGVATKLKVSADLLKNATWLTEFEDRSSPRRGTDEVYFWPNSEIAPVHRPVIVREVVEYYDAPEEAGPGSDPEAKTPYWVVLVAVIGGVAFLSILGGLIFVMARSR